MTAPAADMELSDTRVARGGGGEGIKEGSGVWTNSDGPHHNRTISIKLHPILIQNICTLLRAVPRQPLPLAGAQALAPACPSAPCPRACDPNLPRQRYGTSTHNLVSLLAWRTCEGDRSFRRSARACCGSGGSNRGHRGRLTTSASLECTLASADVASEGG